MNEEFKKIKDFLHESFDAYSNEIEASKSDLEFYSGNQWSNELKKDLGRRNNSFIISELPKYINAIKSSASKNEFHGEIVESNNVELTDKLQKALNKVESENQFKLTMLNALESAIIHGQGVISLSTIDKKGIAYPILEHIRDVASVAFDPNCVEDNKSDAEAGAIVQFISKSKAKRLYKDVDFEEISDKERTSFPTCWIAPKNSFTQITYYELNEDGGVNVQKWIGKNKVVDEQLTISRIPLYKICGYIMYRDSKFVSTGVVDKIRDLQIGANLAYSNIMSRMSRSVKAGYIVTEKSIEGLESQINKLSEGSVPLFIYKEGTTAPTPIIEAFHSEDLVNVLSTTQSLISSNIGVPSEGIQGINNVNTTATEVLVQQENAESNVSCFYDSLKQNVAEIGRTIIQLLAGKTDLEFEIKVVNTTDNVNQNAKNRKEIINMMQMVDDKTRPVLASFYAKNLDDKIGVEIEKNIVANLDENTEFVGDEENAEVKHIINQSKAVIEEQVQIIDNLQAQLAEAEKNLELSNLEMFNTREQRELDWQKFILTHKLETETKALELRLKNEKIANDFEKDMTKLQIDAEKNLEATIEENNLIIKSTLEDMTEEEAMKLLEMKMEERGKL